MGRSFPAAGVENGSRGMDGERDGWGEGWMGRGMGGGVGWVGFLRR